jgi:hypothetical protein
MPWTTASVIATPSGRASQFGEAMKRAIDARPAASIVSRAPLRRSDLT